MTTSHAVCLGVSALSTLWAYTHLPHLHCPCRHPQQREVWRGAPLPSVLRIPDVTLEKPHSWLCSGPAELRLCSVEAGAEVRLCVDEGFPSLGWGDSCLQAMTDTRAESDDCLSPWLIAVGL